MGVDPAQIRRLPLFVDLPDDAIAMVARSAVLMRRAAGEVLFLEGDPAPGMFIVLAGRIKVLRTSPGGREQVLRVVEPGQQFNLVPVFDGGPCPANTVVYADATLLLLPAGLLRQVALEFPQVASSLLMAVCSHLRSLVELVDALALHTVQGRLARLLLNQAVAAERGEVVAPLSQAEMATRLGTVREMVSRSLKVFEALGLIQLDRGVIAITDRAGLEAQADS